MRIPRSILYILFPAFLCYYAAVADAALQGRGLGARPAAMPSFSRIMPHLSLPSQMTDAVSEAVNDLRTAIITSRLMQESLPDPEQERRDFVALWADLQPARTMATPERLEKDPGASILIPGQD